MRLIDADALHDALKAKQLWVVRCGDKHNEGYTYDQVHFAIDDAPSIDIEPKRGEWIKTPNTSFWFTDRIYKCSVCGNTLDFYGVNANRGDANFCPNCGADMRERECE